MPEVARLGLARFWDAFLDRDAFPYRRGRRILARDKALGLLLALADALRTLRGRDGHAGNDIVHFPSLRYIGTNKLCTEPSFLPSSGAPCRLARRDPRILTFLRRLRSTLFAIHSQHNLSHRQDLRQEINVLLPPQPSLFLLFLLCTQRDGRSHYPGFYRVLTTATSAAGRCARDARTGPSRGPVRVTASGRTGPRSISGRRRARRRMAAGPPCLVWGGGRSLKRERPVKARPFEMPMWDRTGPSSTLEQRSEQEAPEHLGEAASTPPFAYSAQARRLPLLPRFPTGITSMQINPSKKKSAPLTREFGRHSISRTKRAASQGY